MRDRASRALRLDTDGAELHSTVLSSDALGELTRVLADQPADQAGIRLFRVSGLEAFLEPQGPIGRLTADMGGQPRAVRAILFDKSPTTNWSLAWHQDRVVAVRERVDVEGFGPWSRKHGALHVGPPFELLATMRTLRVHLDPVPETNAPLLVAPGSHRFGRIAESDVPRIVDDCGVATCLADPGDVWVYSTPILHASERAAIPTHRRVLQIDYADSDLPGGLEWLGV